MGKVNITLLEDFLDVLALGLRVSRNGCDSEVEAASRVVEQMKQEAKLEYRFGSGWRPCGSPEEIAEALVRDVEVDTSSLEEVVRELRRTPVSDGVNNIAVLVHMALLLEAKYPPEYLEELLVLVKEKD